MKHLLLIAALHRVTAFSKELQEFEGLADSYDDWYEDKREEVAEQLSDWEDDWDDLDDMKKEQKISEAIREDENYEDSSMIFFRNPRRLPEGTWVVHRTRADDPRDILDDLDGCGPNNIGLTFHYGCSDGPLMFGLGLDQTSATDMSQYGTNGMIFKVGEAVAVEHISDNDPNQIVFDNTTIMEAYPYIDDGKNLTFYNAEGEEVAELENNKSTFKKFVRSVS